METDLDRTGNKEMEFNAISGKVPLLKNLKLDYFKEGFLVDICDHMKNWGLGEVKERSGDMAKVRQFNWPGRSDEVSI